MNVLTRRLLCLVAVGGLLVACAITASEPAKPLDKPLDKPEAATAKEKATLTMLHHNAVEIFVDRPGFGMRRMMMNLDDLLVGPKSLAERNAKPRQPGPEKPDTEKPAPKAEKPSHYAVQDLLVEGGYGRFATDDGKETWQLSKFHLVGLVKHDDPVVYLTDSNPKKREDKPKAAKDIPTRKVDDFEKAALAAIRNGEPMLAEKSSKTMRVLAPIFAGKRCTACHDQGTLLGAFTYEMERVAHDPEKDGVRRLGRGR